MASINIQSIVATGPGWNQVVAMDGNTYTLSGTYAWRSNNPGNIEYGPFARSMGAIGQGAVPAGRDRGFAIFPTLEQGQAARAALLFDTERYSNLTIEQAISRYAPPNENNTAAYLASILAATGATAATRMGDLTQAQRQAFLDAQERVEGFRQGTVTNADGERVNIGSLSPAAVYTPGQQNSRTDAPQPATASPQTALSRMNAPLSETGRQDLSATPSASRIGSMPTFAELQSAFGRTDPIGLAPGYASLQHMMQAIPVPATMSPDVAASRGQDARPAAIALDMPALPSLPSIPVGPVNDGVTRAGDLPSIPGPLADWAATRFNPNPTVEDVMPLTIQQAAERYTPVGVDPQAVVNAVVAATGAKPNTVIQDLNFFQQLSLKGTLDKMGKEYETTGKVSLPPAPRSMSPELAAQRDATPATQFAAPRSMDPVAIAPTFADLQAAFQPGVPTASAPSQAATAVDPVGIAPSFADMQNAFGIAPAGVAPTGEQAQSVIDATFAAIGNPESSVPGTPGFALDQTFANLGLPSVPQVTPATDPVAQTFSNLSGASQGSLSGINLGMLAPSISTSIASNPNVISVTMPSVPSAPTPAVMDGVTQAIRGVLPGELQAPTPAIMDGVTAAIRGMPVDITMSDIGKAPSFAELQSTMSPGNLSNMSPTAIAATTGTPDTSGRTSNIGLPPSFAELAAFNAPSMSRADMSLGHGQSSQAAPNALPAIPTSPSANVAPALMAMPAMPALPALSPISIAANRAVFSPTAAMAPAYSGGAIGTGYGGTANGYSGYAAGTQWSDPGWSAGQGPVGYGAYDLGMFGAIDGGYL